MPDKCPEGGGMSALGIDGAIHYGEGENPLKQSEKHYQTQTTYGEEAGVGAGNGCSTIAPILLPPVSGILTQLATKK